MPQGPVEWRKLPLATVEAAAAAMSHKELQAAFVEVVAESARWEEGYVEKKRNWHETIQGAQKEEAKYRKVSEAKLAEAKAHHDRARDLELQKAALEGPFCQP